MEESWQHFPGRIAIENGSKIADLATLQGYGT